MMIELVTDQAILERGRAMALVEGYTEGWAIGWSEGYMEGMVLEAKRIQLRQGRQRFGPLPRGLQRKFKAVEDMESLFEMADRMLVVSNWDELIAD
jgi:hypothetical protein